MAYRLQQAVKHAHAVGIVVAAKELGLVEQTEAGAWRVPFNGVEIRVAMVHAA